MPSFPLPPGYYGALNKYQFGMLIILLSIGALFGALVLAFALVPANQPVPLHVELPHILWASTGLITLSSISFEAARYALRRARVASYRRSVIATIVLGVAFICCQLVSWENLASHGVALEHNARGSAFYVFTGFHGLHLLGGMIGAWYV